MSRRVISILIYLVIGLAVIGVITQLVTNTVNFFTSLLVMVGLGVAVFAAIYFLFIKKRTPDEMKKYKQAVKQSKLKYNQSANEPKRPSRKPRSQQSRKKIRKRPTHLRVIEGNKSKSKSKKKRASN